ncbi:hypothetical protein FACS1894167_11450 [Synergistales bacterium]|nr:hypothetical protein FACS1894167_11450 [Synergistales bacterium]
MRETLRTILDNHSDALSDKQKLKGLLTDYLPDNPQGRNLLMMAYDEDIPAQLQQAGEMSNMDLSRCVKKLENNHGVIGDNARAAVNAWAYALGISVDDEAEAFPAEPDSADDYERSRRSAMLENKVREVFAEMVVLKDPTRSKFFSDLSLPSYMRDWLVMKFSDANGNIDIANVSNYIKRNIPSREDFEEFKFQLISGESVRFLARIRVWVDTKYGKTIFELPDFGGQKSGAGGEVEMNVVGQWKERLLRESENWGIIDLTWEQNFSSSPPKGVIKMIAYNPFCPYTVDLNYYREARAAFTTEEWIDVLISAVDYNPNGYDSEKQKLYFIRRLLPFLERRVNIIELAPKGTGKSYVYEKISKRGWLIAGGTVSRASLIYDNAKKMGGLITRFDYVAFDEIQTMTFAQPSQIQTALKHYMEFGEIKGFDAQLAADAGIVVLGNIDADRFSTGVNMVESINPIFRESATLDRFHGIIPGWEIPRLNRSLVANGWAINTEYFAEVLHKLRGELIYATIVDSCLEVPEKADQRDMTAVKRLCSAFVKLLFPHAASKDDIPKNEFIKYCLEPAMEMRGAIKKQLRIVDPGEFNMPGKRDMPEIVYKVN